MKSPEKKRVVYLTFDAKIKMNVSYLVPLIIVVIFSLLEAKRKKKADRLLERASILANASGNRPIDLMATRPARKYLTSNSTLNHVEDKIRFVEKSQSCRNFDFQKRFWSFDQRFADLEKRTKQLEQTHNSSNKSTHSITASGGSE